MLVHDMDTLEQHLDVKLYDHQTQHAHIMHICTYTDTQIHTYTHTHIHTYTYTYTHTHIHTYTHTHIHTYTLSLIHI